MERVVKHKILIQDISDFDSINVRTKEFNLSNLFFLMNQHIYFHKESKLLTFAELTQSNSLGL